MASTAAERRRSLRVAGVAAAAVLALAACGNNAATEPPPATGAATYGPRLWLTIEFAFDSARIRPDYYPTLDNLAVNLTNYPGAQIYVNGHTDLSGRFGYNIALSNRRAQAVVDYLAARGIPRAYLHPQGFGPLQLADPAHPFSPVNRRVEIQLSQQ